MKESEAGPSDRKEEVKGQGRGINVELLEHRVNELAGDTEEINKDIKDVRSKIGDIREDIREIKTEIKHMASKSWILLTIIGSTTLIIAVIGLMMKFFMSSPSADQELMKIILELVEKD